MSEDKEISFEMKEHDPNESGFSMYKFMSDWRKLLDKTKDESEEYFKIDLTDLKDNWHIYPMGELEIPFTINDDREEMILRIKKTTEEFPIEKAWISIRDIFCDFQTEDDAELNPNARMYPDFIKIEFPKIQKD